ncbi:inorganic phosphate transporter [Thermotoga profunda]|uniref:inorganic phosphate transporter n=1 Tax=Thermotoga profunda TaxID=1508420 RepID=UPI0005973001|nr:inorganic phosphate transporter [Thermotoga profunda]
MLILLAFASGFAMAFAIGANDVANSMATAVGAKAITPKQAVIIASFLEFSGAVLFGSHVTSTITKGILKPNIITQPDVLITGAFAALISSSIWILVATIWGMPVSTTHSIVGSMAGFGIAAVGWNAVNWKVMISIISSWILSPLAGGVLAYSVFKLISIFILRRSSPAKAVKKAGPVIIWITFFVIVYLLGIKTLKIGQSNSVWLAVFIASIAAFTGYLLLRRYYEIRTKDYEIVENVFRRLQIMTSCYVSFSHGANDVANAIGPLAVIYWVIGTGTISSSVEVPIWILMLGGLGISLGVLLLGYRVMKTIGGDITQLNNTRGFCIDFSTASTVLISSVLGLPVSTTHIVVGSVVGVGMARGVEVVNVGVLKNIVLSWLATVPLAAGLSAFLFKFLIKII